MSVSRHILLEIELETITTKTYIVKNLKHDLLSGKGLNIVNKAGYGIILDEDPEESGIFAVQPDGKVCKSKSFPFMSEHSSLFLSLNGKIDDARIWKYVWV